MTPTTRALLRPLAALATLGLLLSACTGGSSQPPPPPAPAAQEQPDAGVDPMSAALSVPAPDEPAEAPPPRPPEPPAPERIYEETEKFPESVPQRRIAPATLARLSKSLATLSGGDGTPAVVVARQGDRLILLTPHAASDSQVTYHAGARSQTVLGIRILRYDERSETYLVSAPAPKFPVPLLPVEPLRRLAPGSSLLLVTSGARPRLEPVRVLSQTFRGPEALSLQTSPGASFLRRDRLLIDPALGRVVAVAETFVRQNEPRGANSIAPLLKAGDGRLVRAVFTVSPEEGDRCRVEGEVVLDNPLADALEVGLALSEPGQEPAWREGPDIEELRTSVAQARVRPDGTAILQGTFEPCRAGRHAQLWIHGKRMRRWSQPVPLPRPDPGPRSWSVATHDRHWSVATAEGEPLQPRSSWPPVPPNARCKPLDPHTVYLRNAFVSQSCADSSTTGTGVAALLEPTQTRCLGFTSEDALHGIQPDGWMLDAKEGVYRLRAACPRFSERGPQWAMPAVALDPCGPEGKPRAPAFFAPDGGLVFQCAKGYANAWGMPVDFRGGTLVRLGAEGRALVVAPRGGLAVLGPDGIADEVLGLPEEACLQESCLVASHATDTGFLVALRPASLNELPGPFYLYEIGFDGQAKERGAFPEVPGGQRENDLRLDAQGRLFISAGAPAQVFVLQVGQAESRLLAGGPGASRQQPLTFLSGPRGSGPTELKRPELPPDAAARWTYRRPRQLGTECDSRIQRFDPERLYLYEAPRVWDAEDPTQRSFGLIEDIDILWATRQGQLLYRRGGEFHTFVPDDWRRERGGSAQCRFDAAGQRPDLRLQLCEDPEDTLQDLRLRQDADALVITCYSRKRNAPYLLHEGRQAVTPGASVRGTGLQGLLLMHSAKGFKDVYHLVRPKGAPIEVTGLPEGMTLWTTKASAEGLDLILVKQRNFHEPPTEPPELWTLDARGQASRVGAYPAELVSGGKRLNWVQLRAGRGLYASSLQQDGATDVVVSAELGEAPPKVLFTGPANPKRRPVIIP